MSHVRRMSLAALFIFAILVLGVVIDTAVFEVMATVEGFDVQDGPFGAVLGHVNGVALAVVPIMLFGVAAWVIYGTIQEERQEVERRRIR